MKQLYQLKIPSLIHSILVGANYRCRIRFPFLRLLVYLYRFWCGEQPPPSLSRPYLALCDCASIFAKVIELVHLDAKARLGVAGYEYARARTM